MAVAPILSHPFRLDAAGRVVTVDQGSDEANAEQLAVLLLTRPGSRPLAPSFGIPDPTFEGVDAGAITAAVGAFGPDVEIRDVTAQDGRPGEQHVLIEFT